MFPNIRNFTEFKAICVKENIEFHTYTVTFEKTLIVMLKGMFQLPLPTPLPLTRISENIRVQGLNLCRNINSQQIPHI